MRAFLTLVTFAGLLALAVSHAGQWVALGDSLAVVRPFLLGAGAAFVIALVWAGMVYRATVTGFLIGLSAVLTVIDFQGDTATQARPTLRLYQKNLLWNNPQPEQALADILATNADFVTLQETSRDNAVVMDGLAERYPYSLDCQSQGNGGIAVLSRYPLQPAEAGCDVGSGIVIARAEVPNLGPVWIGSVHLNWPYPYQQSEQLSTVLAGLAALEGPKIVAGDFNMVPWGSSVRRIADVAGAQRLGGYGQTYVGLGRFVPLVIDHILIPEGWSGTVERRPLAGGDHYGLFAIFGQ